MLLWIQESKMHCSDWGMLPHVQMKAATQMWRLGDQVGHCNWFQIFTQVWLKVSLYENLLCVHSVTSQVFRFYRKINKQPPQHKKEKRDPLTTSQPVSTLQRHAPLCLLCSHGNINCCKIGKNIQIPAVRLFPVCSELWQNHRCLHPFLWTGS